MQIAIDKMTSEQIKAALRRDGYWSLYHVVPVSFIRKAAREGRLLWTRDHIVVTGTDGFEARPDKS